MIPLEKQHINFRKIQKIAILIICALMIINVQIGFYKYKKHIENCLKNETTCFVSSTNYIYIKNAGLWINYTFKVEGKEYKKEENLGSYYQDTMQYLLYKKFLPIVYCKDDPNYCILLLGANHLQDFGLSLPDSLKWTEKYKSKYAN